MSWNGQQQAYAPGGVGNHAHHQQQLPGQQQNPPQQQQPQQQFYGQQQQPQQNINPQQFYQQQQQQNPGQVAQPGMAAQQAPFQHQHQHQQQHQHHHQHHQQQFQQQPGPQFQPPPVEVKVIRPAIWLNPLNGKPLPLNPGEKTPEPAPTPAPAPDAKPESKAPEKGCGCKRIKHDAAKPDQEAHLCVKFCTQVMGCNGSCGFPGDTQRGKKNQKSAPLVKAKEKEKEPEPKPEPVPAPIDHTQPNPVHQPPMQPMHQPQMNSHLPQDPNQMHQMGGDPMMQQRYPHQLPHQQHPEGYMMQQPIPPGVSPNAGPMLPVHPKPAGVTKPGEPQAAYGQQQPQQQQQLPGQAKRPSHAISIVAPAGDPRGPNGKGATFDQMITIYKDVLNNLEAHRQPIRELTLFVEKYRKSWRATKSTGINSITANKARQTDKELAFRKVKGILNKLTPENRSSLKMQMVDVMEQAMKKVDDKERQEVLKEIVAIVYEEAVAVKDFTTVYADLCMDLSRHNVQALQVTTGSEPFRKALITTCQHEYTEAIKKQEQDIPDEVEKGRLRKRALNNIHFVGELYKRQLLTEKIIHSVLKNLLLDNKNLDDERLEKVVKLLETVGRSLEKESKDPKKEDMQRYFETLHEIRMNKGTARLGFLIQDLIDLRNNGWDSRKVNSKMGGGPQTLQDINKQIVMEEMTKTTYSQFKSVEELTVAQVVNCFSQDPCDEEMSKKLMRCNSEELTSLVQDAMMQALNNSDQPNAATITKGLGRFMNMVSSSHLPPCEVTTAAVSCISRFPVDHPSWTHFATFVQGVHTQKMIDSEAAPSVLGMAMDTGLQEQVKALLDIFTKANLPCMYASSLAAKATRTSKDAGAVLQQVRQDSAAWGASCGSAKLLDGLLRDVEPEASALTAETSYQLLSAVLSADWVKFVADPDKLSKWGDHSQYVTLLSSVVGHIGKDKMSQPLSFFSNVIARVNPDRATFAEKYIKSVSEHVSKS